MNNTTAFNLVDVWEVMVRYQKKILTVVIIAMVITALLVFFILPKYYKSEAVIVAANPALADKSRILNNQVQHLYSPYGSRDDLDRLYGIAQLDTILYQVIDEYKLVDHYELTDTRGAKKKALIQLKDDIDLLKSEENELHIAVLTKDRHLSSNIANRLVELVAAVAQLSWRKEYGSALQALQKTIDKEERELVAVSNLLRSADEATQIALLSRRAALVDQLQQLLKAANEYQLAIDNQPAALIVLQNAIPAVIHDKPKKAQVLFAAFFASLAFAILAALVYEKKWAS